MRRFPRHRRETEVRNLMNRKNALGWIRIAGYHNDTFSFVRLYVENRVSRASADQAWRNGVAAKRNGVPCSCRDCVSTVKASEVSNA